MENYQNQNDPQNYQHQNFNGGNENFVTTPVPNTYCGINSWNSINYWGMLLLWGYWIDLRNYCFSSGKKRYGIIPPKPKCVH